MDECLQPRLRRAAHAGEACRVSLVQVTEAAPPKSNRRSRVAEVGLGYKRGSADTRAGPQAGTSSTAEEVSTILAAGQIAASEAGHRVAVAPRQIDVKQHPVRTGADDGSERVLSVR
jgi:hypothetical protein